MRACLAVEWVRYNIQVHSVGLGHMRWDFSKAALANEEIQGEILWRVPTRGVGEPEEAANTVAFLCRQEANSLTGHVCLIDGGQQIAWQ